jgi:negative regulator of flagellin synthesis FlgM
MKIGSTETKAATAATTGAVDRKAATPIKTDGAAELAKPEPSAKVELSSSASVLAAADADPAFDTAKVDRIAQAIRDGKFDVNAEAIADKLIQNAQELLGRKTS